MLDHPVKQSDYLEVCGRNADLQIQNRELRERLARLESDLEDMRAGNCARLEQIEQLQEENDAWRRVPYEFQFKTPEGTRKALEEAREIIPALRAEIKQLQAALRDAEAEGHVHESPDELLARSLGLTLEEDA